MKVEKEQEYTPEQVAEFKKQLTAQLESEIPLLELKKKHQTLITELDELYMRSALAQSRIAQIMAPPPKEADEPKIPNGQPSIERKLKVEKQPAE